MNSKTDELTKALDSYSAPQTTGKSLALPFESSSTEMAGIRVTRAEFSRMMGCSKQAVTDWVKSGRVVVGADGRFDPRQAVASLMRTGDPARIRAKVLEPLVRDIAGRDREIERLRTELAAATEDAAFHEESASELAEILNGLVEQIVAKCPELIEAGANAALSAVVWWVEDSLEKGPASAGMLLDHLRPEEKKPGATDRAAVEGEEEGETINWSEL